MWVELEAMGLRVSRVRDSIIQVDVPDVHEYFPSDTLGIIKVDLREATIQLVYDRLHSPEGWCLPTRWSPTSTSVSWGLEDPACFDLLLGDFRRMLEETLARREMVVGLK